MQDTFDPLYYLLKHLEAEGTVPLAWAVEYAPDGDLGAAWRACTDPTLLFRLGERTAPRAAVLLANCAALREAARVALPLDRVLRRALARVEAIARGEPAAPPTGRELGEQQRWRTASLASIRSRPGQLIALRVLEALDEAQTPRAAPLVVSRPGRDAIRIVLDTALPPRATPAQEAAWAGRVDALVEALRAELPCPTIEALNAARWR